MKIAIEQLKKILNVDESKISKPPKPDMGDFSTTIAFDKAKEWGDYPNIAAVKIMSKINLSNTIFSKVKAYGPYINFFINREALANKVIRNVLKEKDNFPKIKRKREKVVIEFPSPNTNKPLHLGHLLQMAIGLSLSRILEAAGYDLKRTNLYNDRGIHICQSMLAYKKWGKGRKPNKKEDHFVGDFYVMYNKKKNEKLEKELKEMLIAWENGDKKVLSLWKKMNKWCYKGHNKTYKRFGLDKYDKIYYESEFYKDGKKIVLDGFKKGIFKIDDKGAVYAELGELGKKYLLREDKTSIYVTQDIALAKLKYKDFKFDKHIYMTGNEQNFYFQQLFKIFELLNYKFAHKCIHLGTGYVRLPEGKMKSREGKAIYADDLMDDMFNLAKKEIKSRGNKVDDKTADKIGLAAIKYFLLKGNVHKDIVFRPDESINFEGNTGPYLLYALVRADKIVKKARKIEGKIKGPLENGEFELVKDFAEFEDKIEEAANKMSPNVICSFAYKMASDFNHFYENFPVLSEEDKQKRTNRLLIVKSFHTIMKKALYLIGIDPVKEM